MKLKINGLMAGVVIGAALGAGATALSQAVPAPPPGLTGGPLGMAARVIAQQPPLTPWRWDNALQADLAAPKNHGVLFQNDHIKLIEVIVRPGEKEETHGHRYPSVFAIDAMQPKGDNTQVDGVVVDVKRSLEGLKAPTCAAVGPQPPHSFRNTDSFPQHFYRLEFLRLDGDDIQSKTYGQ